MFGKKSIIKKIFVPMANKKNIKVFVQANKNLSICDVSLPPYEGENAEFIQKHKSVRSYLLNLVVGKPITTDLTDFKNECVQQIKNLYEL